MKKEKWVGIRITKELFAMIKTKADQQDLPLSYIIRKILLDSFKGKANANKTSL
ncbi:MAG TPA: hypothetical protein VJ000_01325 [Thermodesulfovibrionia bacterium]|nr:hypothetical protein [Thermodesulfovibrionia bacterium]